MNDKTTFSIFVKEELTNNEYPSIVRKKALLSAYIKINGTLNYSSKGEKLILKNENGKITRFIYSLISELFPSLEVETSFIKSRKKKISYLITIFNPEFFLNELFVSFLEGKISRTLVYNDDTISGYLAGAFLASGSINSPMTSNYHLEICVNNDNYAKWLSKVVSRYRNSDVHPKVASRRDKYIVYLKASASIADFLIMIGAPKSCIEFENVRVDRDFINNSNRLTNLDTANMSKTIEAAKKQISDIKYIESHGGLEQLKNPKAIALARIRKDHDSASLEELAFLLGEELNLEITKTNVNHLLRRIHEVRQKL